MAKWLLECTSNSECPIMCLKSMQTCVKPSYIIAPVALIIAIVITCILKKKRMWCFDIVRDVDIASLDNIEGEKRHSFDNIELPQIKEIDEMSDTTTMRNVQQQLRDALVA